MDIAAGIEAIVAHPRVVAQIFLENPRRGSKSRKNDCDMTDLDR